MTANVDIANRALSAIGTRTQIASLTELSNEAINCNILLEPLRDELIRMAPWNCATTFNNLSLICAAPGTPENPSQVSVVWEKGIPPPPWLYEYAYPSDCVRPLWVVPQFNTGFMSGIPISPIQSLPRGVGSMPVRYRVAVDQIGSGGVPVATGGNDTRVILTDQEQAMIYYLKRVVDPNVMDEQFIQAWVAALAGRLVQALSGDKGLAQQKISEANGFIQIARAGDGNEGLTVNDVTPDWIRARGYAYANNFEFSPSFGFDWGPMLSFF